MERKIKKLLQKGSISGTKEKEQQEILSLFHQENLEFRVKTELTDILDNTNVTGEEEKELRHLFEKIWELISESENKKKKRFLPVNSLLKLAASLLLGLVIGKLVFTGYKETEPNYYTSIAPKGSVSQMILPDSTFIYLNSGSTLKYIINGKKGKREVFLNGEAWFQVQRSADKPFIVHTGFYDVNVMGTEFNVKAYAEEANVVTTLEKGSLLVTSGNTSLQEPLLLKPGQNLVYNKETSTLAVGNVNTRLYTSWKENKLIFINMSFRELVVLLERKYGVDMRVEDPEILNYHYDGTIKNESIIQVMNLLKLTLPIDYKVKDQTIEITRK
jgi:transmembrane sensor